MWFRIRPSPGTTNFTYTIMCDPSAALTPFLYSYPHVKRFVFSTWHALPHSIRGFKCRFDLISLWSPHWHLLMSPSGSLNPTMGGPHRWRSPSCELHHFVYLEQHAALHSCYICVEFPERQRADRPWPQVAHFHTRTLFLFFSFLFFSFFFFLNCHKWTHLGSIKELELWEGC